MYFPLCIVASLAPEKLYCSSAGEVTLKDIGKITPNHIEAWVLCFPDNKVHGANVGPTRGRQDRGGPHVGPMNFAIWVISWEVL